MRSATEPKLWFRPATVREITFGAAPKPTLWFGTAAPSPSRLGSAASQLLVRCLAPWLLGLRHFKEIRLQGKVALITGGASGIGEGTARLFVQHGARVVIADIQDELGNAVCTDLGSSVAVYVHCDVTNEDDVSHAVDLAVQKFGQLDIMFNNAGITGPPIPNTINYPLSDFRRVMDINLIGPFLGTKHAARVMIPKRTGCIISTSSTASLSAGAASHAYTCSKHAVVGLTKNAALELGRHGIRVNCVSPAGLATPMATGYVGMSGEEFEGLMADVAVLKGVVLKTDDIANAVLFLASEDSRFVSGQNLAIDGAYTVGGTINVFKEA